MILNHVMNNSKSILAITLIAALTAPSITKAQSAPDMGIRTDPIYIDTIELCQYQDDKSFWAGAFNQASPLSIAMASSSEIYALGTLDLTAPVKLIKNKGRSAALVRVVNSRAFHIALQECFPNDNVRKAIYVSNLYFLDGIGKVWGGLTFYLAAQNVLSYSKVLSASSTPAYHYAGNGIRFWLYFKGTINIVSSIRQLYLNCKYPQNNVDFYSNPQTDSLKPTSLFVMQEMLLRNQIVDDEKLLRSPNISETKKLEIQDRIEKAKLSKRIFEKDTLDYFKHEIQSLEVESQKPGITSIQRQNLTDQIESIKSEMQDFLAALRP